MLLSGIVRLLVDSSSWKREVIAWDLGQCGVDLLQVLLDGDKLEPSASASLYS